MRPVVWTDQNGYRHRSFVRDADADAAAPGGVLTDPPDLGRLDWEAVRRDIHNALVDAGVSTWQDVQLKQAPIRGFILGAVQRRLTALFREPLEVTDNE